MESEALLIKKASLQTSSARQDNHQLISPEAERATDRERGLQRNGERDEGGVNKQTEGEGCLFFFFLYILYFYIFLDFFFFVSSKTIKSLNAVLMPCV